MRKMYSLAIMVLITILLFETNAQAKSDLLQVFADKTAKLDGKKLKYREVLTAPEDTAQPILVIYLHGGSGGGGDNKKQMKVPAGGKIYDYLNANNVKAYFLVPQCPSNASWNGDAPRQRQRGGRPSPGERRPHEQQKCEAYNKYVKALADYYVSEFGVDSTRIYVFGSSMGGQGVWYLLADAPNYFAAAMVASGGYRSNIIMPLTKTPILCTRGSQESRGDQVKHLIEDINLYGGNAVFQTLEGLDHHEATSAAFTPERIEWVLSHRRAVANNVIDSL